MKLPCTHNVMYVCIICTAIFKYYRFMMDLHQVTLDLHQVAPDLHQVTLELR